MHYVRENEFIPVGLPLLSDAALVKTVVEYGHAHSMLRNMKTPLSVLTRKQIEEALKVIEDELRERGLAS